MKGIVLLNPAFSIGELSKKESLLMQKTLVDKLIDDRKINIVTLNPYQINEYYTIPHALLYDLQYKKPTKIDCLVLYSFETIKRFQLCYPEKWQTLITYFSEIITPYRAESSAIHSRTSLPLLPMPPFKQES
jgi:hypothetical protein